MEELDQEIDEKLNIIFSSNYMPVGLIEYKEVEEPCVALTIIGENRLTTTAVFVKRGIRVSFKAFFSGLILTIMNMFI